MRKGVDSKKGHVYACCVGLAIMGVCKVQKVSVG